MTRGLGRVYGTVVMTGLMAAVFTPLVILCKVIIKSSPHGLTKWNHYVKVSGAENNR